MLSDSFVFNLLLVIIGTQAFVLPNPGTNDIDVGEVDLHIYNRMLVKYFDQHLDHFNIQDKRTFPMRYVEISVFFKTGGPVLLEIGGESDIVTATVQQAQSFELAKQLNGTIFILEHRYYGKSSPFKNLTAQNMVYLNVEQALEDIASFVAFLKKTRPNLQRSKVAAFGCSYSGALATWFRYKYPHLVDAVWSSSAPLRAVADFYEYLEVTSEVYSNVSWNCYNTIKEGYDEIKLFLATPERRNQINQALENWACGDITTMNANSILTNVRYVIADHNTPPDHGSTSCNLLQNVKGNALQSLLLFIKVKSSEVCNDDSTDSNNDVAWLYQTCTEFGFSVTMNSRKQPFNDSFSVIEDDIEACTEFGKEFNLELLQQGIARTNRNYGSQDIKVSKVLSVHGAQDPWHKLGLYRQENEESPVILIPGTSHCADQIYVENEPLELTKAKMKGRKILTKWLTV